MSPAPESRRCPQPAIPEATEFLLRRAKIGDPTEVDRAAAREISIEVGGLPLALDQAGAFIDEAQIAAGEYLNLYRTEGKELRARRGDWSPEHASVGGNDASDRLLRKEKMD
jgi:hypothetical protein